VKIEIFKGTHFFVYLQLKKTPFQV